ncbi:MAG: hypothetical protein EBS70_07335, partial [Actinobacteria bacterium]|nr:hypothetical protein [Actinomycetota bacterium]
LAAPQQGQTDNVVAFNLPGDLTGSVTARWRLVGTDGHVISGRIRFSVQAPAIVAPTVPSPTTTELSSVTGGTTSVPSNPPTTDVQSITDVSSGFDDGRLSVPEPARAALRFANYLAFYILGGLFFAEWYLAVGSIRVPLGGRLVRYASWILLSSSALQTLVFVDDIRASGSNWITGFLDALGTTPGSMLIMKTAICALNVAMTRQVVRAGFLDPLRLRLLVCAGLMYLVTLAYGGHSRSQPAPWLGIPADVAHTAASAVWLGGLFAFVFVVIPHVDDALAVAGFDRFGRAAERAVVVLVVTGIIQSLRMHTNPFSVLTNSHGLLLVTKISLVAVILRLAAQNRRTLLGRRSRMSDSSSRLKRTLVRASLIELALGAAVIAVTAVMVASSPT